MVKRLVEETSESFGLESMIGKRVLLLCGNYFYSGVLSAVGKMAVELKEAAIVYETGDWSASKYKDAQKLGDEPHYVERKWIESFRLAK